MHPRVPARASAWGEGLGEFPTAPGEKMVGQNWPAFEERVVSGCRACYAQAPRGA